ncbi:hypothetical protein Zmor_001169 [Zophobas morio]|uniref:Uncharacterized protein n=1 Tax=Zophobas morio TaxID=2755281 RepID=A0AA38IYQ4_9CUCU|nr:hypothetical protein Zmor_001169 [Zophobas morio]
MPIKDVHVHTVALTVTTPHYKRLHSLQDIDQQVTNAEDEDINDSRQRSLLVDAPGSRSHLVRSVYDLCSPPFIQVVVFCHELSALMCSIIMWTLEGSL